GFLPTKHTDFIFSAISEEFGFVGAVFVVLLLFFIISRCIKIARESDDLFGKYICVGIAAMLIFHTFENVGMCIGLTPVTGIPLPFISYGGTSLIANMIAVGIVLSVSSHSKKARL
ncbi:MAG: FtsW/RodA/SpoVE family cell cycle protein, partial [Clostridia bacterium]|nr:FtsW/RodA/SpoVE family cell cycle protein [Clostridia bacterium]